MKKTAKVVEDDPLDREIDFSNGRRNPFAAEFYKSRNVRILAPDLVDIFPDSESMNEALRVLVRAAAAAPEKISAKRAAAPPPVRKKART